MQTSASMSTYSPPVQLLVGPGEHGVVEYAGDVAAALERCSPGVAVVRSPSAREALHALDALDGRAALGDGPHRVHVHVTDALFGDDLDAAASALASLTTAHRVSLTLHDVPQPSDGERNLPRRAAAYARFVEGAVGVAVNSRHEAQLLAEHVTTAVTPRVIPLGTRRSVSPPADLPGAGSRDVELLMSGYVYPGKGHSEVIAAAAALARRGAGSVGITVLGGVVPRHAAEAERLIETAADAGVDFTITGYLDRASYVRLLGSPGVPVIAHRHYSASRSLLDWPEHGRRPLVVRTRYTDEMAELRPGTLHLAEDSTEALADGIERLHGEAGATILRPGTPLEPSLDTVARASLDWWEGLPW